MCAGRRTVAPTAGSATDCPAWIWSGQLTDRSAACAAQPDCCPPPPYPATRRGQQRSQLNTADRVGPFGAGALTHAPAALGFGRADTSDRKVAGPGLVTVAHRLRDAEPRGARRDGCRLRCPSTPSGFGVVASRRCGRGRCLGALGDGAPGTTGSRSGMNFGIGLSFFTKLQHRAWPRN
jgi:hypothetical protein